MLNTSSRISLSSVNRVLFYTANEQRAYASLKPPPKKFLGHRVCQGNAHLFQRKMTRKFTLDCLNKFGTDVEEVKLILGNQHSYFRKLPDRKRQQFSALYRRAMEDMMAGDGELCGILITKIVVPLFMENIIIHWRCTGDVQRDQEIDQLLEKHATHLRKKLSELFFHTPVPPLIFMEDRHHLYQEEMNKLFEIADYGMQYRAVSAVGAILGSTKDTGTRPIDPNDPNVPKEKVPPRWLANWRRRTTAAAENEEKQ